MATPQTFFDLGTYPKEGQKVRIVRLEETPNALIGEHYLRARQRGEGVAKAPLSGYGGSFWYVKHGDGSTGAYTPRELSPSPDGKPKMGDRAYTEYRGQRYEGIITHIDNSTRGIIESANPEDDWGWHRDSTYWVAGVKNRRVRGLFFNSVQVSWDDTASCWHCPADED